MTELSFEAQVENNYHHNFIANFLDGTLFWAGASFVNSSTILPLYVNHFTDSKLLLGLIPAIASGGWLLPQLFTAYRVEKLPVKKVFLIPWSFFLERLPFLVLALSTWLFAGDAPAFALVFFYISYSWHAVGAGLVAVGWQDMIAKVIPRQRIGRFFGITNFMGTVTGLVGATAAAWMLTNFDFPGGFTLSFFAASILMFVSWVCLAQTREPAQQSTKAPKTQREYWRGLPKVLQEDLNFRRYLISRMIITLGGMGDGFVAVYAVERWSLADSQAGYFTTALLVGQAVFNLVFGFLADRRGHKLVLELSVLNTTLAVGLAMVATEPEWFYLVFALTGGGIAGYIMSGISIAFEFSPADVRPTYIGLNNTINGVVSIFSPLLGALLAITIGYQGLFGVAALVGLCGFGLLHWWVVEPRQVTAKTR